MSNKRTVAYTYQGFQERYESNMSALCCNYFRLMTGNQGKVTCVTSETLVRVKQQCSTYLSEIWLPDL